MKLKWQIHQHNRWFLNCRLNCSERKSFHNVFWDHMLAHALPQECDSFATINKAVVVCEGDVHHGSDHHLAVPDHWPLEDTVHAKDGGLRRVDDGRAEQRPICASITVNNFV